MRRPLLALLLAGAGLASAAPLPAALERPALAVVRPAQANLQAITRAGSRLVAAGERGLVIYSDDGGAHWSQARVPVSVTLTALRFANARDGWAVGAMGVVLKTSDGGANWKRVLEGQRAAALAEQAAQQAWDAARPDPANAEHPLNLLLEDAHRLADEGPDKPLLDIDLRNDGSVWVIGAYGMAFSSHDGGHSWQARMKDLPNPGGATLYGVARRGQERYLFGEQGLLLRAQHADSSESGYVAQGSPSSGSLFGALALRDGTLMLFGLRGKVYRSAWPGAPWSELQTPVDATLLAGLQLADDSVLLLGSAGQVLLSRDRGLHFAPLPLATRFPFTGAALAADGALLLVGTRGLLRIAPAELATLLAPSKS